MSERTNPKGDPDAGIGSAGEPLTRTIELALRVQPAELTADSFKWARRIKALAAALNALTTMRGTKLGKAKAVVDKATVVNERVQGGPAKDESKQASSVSVHSQKDYSVTPESQIEATSTSPVPKGEDTE